MKKLVVGLAMGAMAVSLAGCEPQDYSYVDEEDQKSIAALAEAELAAEKQELRDALAKLKESDPEISDLYTSVNEQGEKVVHVVKETADGVQEEQMAMMNGMVLGMLMGQMMNAGGYNNYANANRSTITRTSYTRDVYRNKRNSASTNAYVASRSRAAASYRSSSAFQSKISARSSAAFASSSSARAGGYSSGG